ncbi:hypothetical protein L1987_58440 [Smallanthus sonchifolius]|uniref:Uncharacterized protein n=1 Tax=Smallanthus sonchifolius TaxID=185202 RepID=A0ACB9DF84_9ASTR|nr:hypothetical protein L1987_58440 [Smallanthus sonchifolius]
MSLSMAFQGCLVASTACIGSGKPVLLCGEAFFSVAGSYNDINVLDQSPVFDDIENSVAPGSSFIANDN